MCRYTQAKWPQLMGFCELGGIKPSRTKRQAFKNESVRASKQEGVCAWKWTRKNKRPSKYHSHYFVFCKPISSIKKTLILKAVATNCVRRTTTNGMQLACFKLPGPAVPQAITSNLQVSQVPENTFRKCSYVMSRMQMKIQSQTKHTNSEMFTNQKSSLNLTG